MRLGVLLSLVGIMLAAEARAQSEHAHEQKAVVVLIGAAGASEALRAVIAELLGRQGVTVELDARVKFEPDAWLDAGAEDNRAYAFVAVPDDKRAQLYFRGPRGERFLLRELALRAGLDEVGRELIAGVVETSTVTLLRSTEGVSKEEARAELAKSEPPTPEPRPLAPEPKREEPKPALPPARTLFFLCAPYVALQGTGEHIGLRFMAGLELGIVLAAPGWPRLRPRLVVGFAEQELSTADARADVGTLLLRVGLDVELLRGLYAGVSTGLDQVHVEPSGVRDDDLFVASSSTERLPSSRAELRYELALTETLRVGLGALVDVPWTAQHYDVIREGEKRRAASSWALQPGAIATFGAEL